MLREAAVNVAPQWKFEEGAAQERATTLKFSFVILPRSSKLQGQRQSRQILRAQTTRCSG